MRITIRWHFDDKISLALKLFTGEINPSVHPEMLKVNLSQLRDKRRVFLTELKDDVVQKILSFFTKNKILVVSDILKGRGGFAANINTAMNFFGQGDVRVSPNGSLYIGRITMQRKGGTPDPTKLQFKIKPCEIFKLGYGGNDG